jgi:hypothetical protein
MENSMWTYDRVLIAEKMCELVKVGDRVKMPYGRFIIVNGIFPVEDSYTNYCSTCFNVVYEFISNSELIIVPPVSVDGMCEKCTYFIK